MAKKVKAQATPQVKVVSIESITNELVKNVSEQMSGAGIQLSPRTVMEVLKIAMEAVEGSPVKGAEQKDLAIKVVLEIATNAGLPEDQLTVIRALVDGGFVSDTIDLVVAASQGKLNVNQVQEVAKGCFKTCFGSMFKRQSRANTPAIDNQAPKQQTLKQTQQPTVPLPQQPPVQQAVQQAVQQVVQQAVLQQPAQQTQQQQPTVSIPMIDPREVSPTIANKTETDETLINEEVIEVPIQSTSNTESPAITEQM